MMLMTFKFFSQAFSTMIANSLTALLRLVVSDILDVLIHLMDDVRSLMNADSSSLSLSQTSSSLYFYNHWTDFHKLSCAGKLQIRVICTYVGCTKVTTND